MMREGRELADGFAGTSTGSVGCIPTAEAGAEAGAEAFTEAGAAANLPDAGAGLLGTTLTGVPLAGSALTGASLTDATLAVAAMAGGTLVGAIAAGAGLAGEPGALTGLVARPFAAGALPGARGFAAAGWRFEVLATSFPLSGRDGF